MTCFQLFMCNFLLIQCLDSLVSLDTLTPDILQIIVKVLRTILVDSADEWLDTTPSIKELLARVLETYQRGKLPKEIRTRILIMLCDIVLDHKLYAAYGSNIFSNWLPTLPKLLCQPYVSPHILKMFSHLARQQNPIFMKHLDENQEAIIGNYFFFRDGHFVFHLANTQKMSFITANLPQIQISGLENQLEGRQEIINLFFWLKSWKPDQSDISKKHLRNEWPMIEKLLQIK